MRAPNTRSFAAAGTAVLLLLLGACGSDDTGGAVDSGQASAAPTVEKPPFEVDSEPVATDSVTLPRSYKFEPAAISVTPGTTVTWENKDNFPHNVKLVGVTANSETKDLSIGATTSITFDEAGTFYYQCTLHPSQMKGVVIVEA